MPKIHLDRLKSRYGYSGGNYADLMSSILEHQSQMISNRLGEVQKRKLDQHADRARKVVGRNLQVPELAEVLPARSVHIRKAAERGRLLSDRLRSELSKNLRDAVAQYLAEGQPTMQYQRGQARGRIKPQLIDRFEKTIKATFKDYSRRDPLIGVPPNIRMIATTEVMGAMNEIKHGYMDKLAERNPEGIEIKKRWKHHMGRSKIPRPGHMKTDGKTIAIGEAFHVPVFERIGTIKSGLTKGRPRWKNTGAFVDMLHPGDPQAPISEIASCNCELDYLIVVKAETPKRGTT